MAAKREAKRPRLRRALRLILIILILLAASAAVYTADFHHADESARACLETPAPGIMTETSKGKIAFIPEEPKAGLIFYPGGKVEYTAYAPLMEKLAQEGILCVLLKMPLNLAVLDRNAAEGVANEYPAVSRWAVGGHSLGGVMAASYAAGHPGSVDALVLLASYSTANLTDKGIDALSIYGTEDGVLSTAAYEKNRANLPSDLSETVIDGGCHSYFGNYGMQKGDGEPYMSRDEQQLMTAVAVAEFLS